MRDRNRKVELPSYYDQQKKVYTLRFTKEFLPHFRNLIRTRADLVGQKVKIKIYRRSKPTW
jgi:hypothetical protein